MPESCIGVIESRQAPKKLLRHRLRRRKATTRLLSCSWPAALPDVDPVLLSALAETNRPPFRFAAKREVQETCCTAIRLKYSSTPFLLLFMIGELVAVSADAVR